MRKQIQTAELRIMMQKDVTCKNRRDREEKSVPPVFFLPVGEMKKCTEKEQKKMKKYVKISCISGNKMLYYKTNFCAWTFF